ncbi:MAG: CRTAC1 family protein [Pirellulaceae bacterium]
MAHPHSLPTPARSCRLGRLSLLGGLLLLPAAWAGCNRGTSDASSASSANPAEPAAAAVADSTTTQPQSTAESHEPVAEASAAVTQPAAAPSSGTPSATPPAVEVDQAVAVRLAEREQLDKTLWRQEIVASRHGQYFVSLWDRLRAAKDQLSLLHALELPQLKLPASVDPQPRDLGVEAFHFGEPSDVLSQADWRGRVEQWQQQGYEIVQTEWHHRRFDLSEDGRAESLVEMEMHVANSGQKIRVILAADLHVHWRPGGEGETAVPESVEVADLRVWRRQGEPPFRLAATLPIDAESAGDAADFLGMYDLDSDGDAEIVFGNRRFRNDGGGRFSAQPLSPHRKTGLTAAVMADFNNDGRADLFCADPGQSPQVFLADAAGQFSLPPLTVSIPPVTLSQAITAGDADRDGNLDVWLTQYKGPYDSGQMPTPYYDANDGYPSYMLFGDGQGGFRDVTESSGLAAKRFRRTYSSSLVDLDDDRDLDLLVVSDFAGVDMYTNDGTGKFMDASASMLDDRNNFGMSHVFDDFNNDGRLDFYVTGMASTTARRLEQMGIRHPQFDEHNKMRPVMGYGNRMYLSDGKTFQQPPYREDVARTGWSWGTTAIDFDNDGDRDLFVGNGHISGSSASDYCSIFWRHDIYSGSSKPDPVLSKLFLTVQGDFERQKGGSWNGFEHNCLLVQNQDGFTNYGFLMGVADEFDTRAVVGNDIDSDGRVDLLVVESPRGRPSVLHVLRNNLDGPNRWIGVRLIDQPGHSPLGARVTLTTSSGSRIAQVVAGDSFTAQHPAAVHFGLGGLDRVEQIEVRWQDGAIRRLNEPAVNQYHLLGADKAAEARP